MNIKIIPEYWFRMLLVTKCHHQRGDEAGLDKNQTGDISSVSDANTDPYLYCIKH